MPNTNIRLDMSNLRVIATMNPTSVGGGRSRLPVSIISTFSQVRLDTPSDEELSEILVDTFEPLVQIGLLPPVTIKDIFSFHQDVGSLLSNGSLGRVTAPFNLRDLIKARDMLLSIMQDHLDEYHMRELLPTAAGSAASVDDGIFYEAPGAGKYLDEDDVRVAVLINVLDIIYAGRFKGQDEQQAVREAIAKHFSNCLHSQGKNSKGSAVPEVDDSVAGTVKIGSIYIAKGMMGGRCVLDKHINVCSLHMLHHACELLHCIAICTARQLVLYMRH